jgi:hypothetical protein
MAMIASMTTDATGFPAASARRLRSADRDDADDENEVLHLAAARPANVRSKKL